MSRFDRNRKACFSNFVLLRYFFLFLGRRHLVKRLNKASNEREIDVDCGFCTQVRLCFIRVVVEDEGLYMLLHHAENV